MPGAVGGTNWGNTAANPRAGMLYLLNQDFPSFYKLQEQADRRRAGGAARFGPPDPETVERGGQALYKESCAMCHGADRAGTPAAPSLLAVGAQIGLPQFRRIVIYGNGRMPPHRRISATSRSPTFSRSSAAARGRAGAAAMPARRRRAGRAGGRLRRCAARAGARARRRSPSARRTIPKASPRRRSATSPTTAWGIPIYSAAVVADRRLRSQPRRDQVAQAAGPGSRRRRAGGKEHRRAARLAAPGHDRHLHRHRVLHRARRRAVRLRCGQWRSAVVGTSCPWAPKVCRPSTR